MTIGSLFSGIGGLEFGLERAGFGPTIWHAEKDEFCRSVLQKHWPESRVFSDVKAIRYNTVDRPDIICGGFPCQDISVAGKAGGIRAERSGLWFEFARIIGELRPPFVVVENVTALLARGLSEVLGSLAALGYNARWDCIPASAVGAHHRRDRLFVVAWRVSNADALKIRKRTERRQSAAQATKRRHDESSHMGEWPPKSDDMQSISRLPPDTKPAICGVADGLSNGLDERAARKIRRERIAALGNAVVPQVAEVVGGWIYEILDERCAAMETSVTDSSATSNTQGTMNQ